MARGDFRGSGEAFLGQASLGQVDVRLVGFETSRMRKADGDIVFESGPVRDVLGQRIKIIPDGEGEPFFLVVTGILNGRTTVASDGAMPWWR